MVFGCNWTVSCVIERANGIGATHGMSDTTPQRPASCLTSRSFWLLVSGSAGSLRFPHCARPDQLLELEQEWPAEVSTWGLSIRSGLTHVVAKTERLPHKAIHPPAGGRRAVAAFESLPK